MQDSILGLHHITAIAGEAQRNYDFYTGVLGLRLVKKTVNFDDPGTYHFYYGDETGTPGTIVTFFPGEGIVTGRKGSGMATNIGYAVPKESLAFWQARFEKLNLPHGAIGERFADLFLSFQDPDGLSLELVVPKEEDHRKPWTTSAVKESVAIRGFHSVTLTLKNMKHTADLLAEIFGYQLMAQEGNRYRFLTESIQQANIIDIIESPNEMAGHVAGGTNHHVAFRVKDESVLMEYREKIAARGLHITPKIDRNYFFSLYFREPGGVLFELATDNPGFAIDEPVNELGVHLKLPLQYEKNRSEIEKALPSLDYSSTSI
jgi:glyoxalase family protein